MSAKLPQAPDEMSSRHLLHLTVLQAMDIDRSADMTNAELAQQFLDSAAGAVMAGDDPSIDIVNAVVSALLAVADSIDRLAAAQDLQIPSSLQIVKSKPKEKRAKAKG